MNEEALALRVEGLAFSYNGEPVLEGVILQVPQRGFVCFVGPNGGGKSTLFRIFLGLLQPQQGSIEVLGQAPELARKRVGYVPQDFSYDPHFPVRVSDVVRMGCLGGKGFWGFRRQQDEESVRRALHEVGLCDVSHRWFKSLSGGQRQRVLIARALVTAPEILLLDEPTANVDALGEEEILTVLEALRGRLTILMVTHSPSVASHFLDAIVCVNRWVHIHPAVEEVDEKLMRHICGYEALPASSCAIQRVGG